MWPPLNGEGLPATRASRQRGPPGNEGLPAMRASRQGDPGGAGERPWRGPAFWYSTRGHILGKGPSRDRPPALSRMAVSMAVTDASSLSGLARLSFFRKQPRKELPYLRLLNEYIQLPYLCLLNEEDFWLSGTGCPGTGPEPAVCMGAWIHSAACPRMAVGMAVGMGTDPGGAGERPWRGPAFWYSTRGHILGKGPSRDRPPALSRITVSMAVTDASSLSGLRASRQRGPATRASRQRGPPGNEGFPATRASRQRGKGSSHKDLNPRNRGRILPR